VPIFDVPQKPMCRYRVTRQQCRALLSCPFPSSRLLVSRRLAASPPCLPPSMATGLLSCTSGLLIECRCTAWGEKAAQTDSPFATKSLWRDRASASVGADDFAVVRSVLSNPVTSHVQAAETINWRMLRPNPTGYSALNTVFARPFLRDIERLQLKE